MKPVLAMITAAMLWSMSGLFIKVLSLDNFSLAGFRSVSAVIALIALARLRGLRMGWPSSLRLWLASLTYALEMLLFICANRLTTATNAIFLQYTAPVYVLLLEPLLLRTKLRLQDVGFVAFVLVAMSLFFVGHLDAGNQLGNFLALGSGLFYALFTLLMRSKENDEAGRWQALTTGNAVLAGVAGLYFLISGVTPMRPASIAELGAVFFAGAVQISCADMFAMYALSHISALEVTLFGMIDPALNPLWVYIGTGEVPSVGSIAGATMIIVGTTARAVLAQRALTRERLVFDIKPKPHPQQNLT
jgi:DME family drug/metabolite transporter